MDKYKITDSEINENNVKSAADLLKGEPRDNKNIFDRLPELIATKFNSFIDAVVSNFYTKTETEEKINQKVSEMTNGGMSTFTYDKNNNGIVDDAEKLGGREAGVYLYQELD